MHDDAEALTLRHGRISLQLMFSAAVPLTHQIGYWLLPLHDGHPMFPAHWFRQLEDEIDAGQPPGSIFANDGGGLGWAIDAALTRGEVSRWQSGLPEVTALFIPGGRGSITLSDRRELAADWFDVIFAFHAARAGQARGNVHDAGPCVRLSVQRPMLERFLKALRAGIDARTAPDPYDLMADEQSGPPDE
jgi:hypothetical protein